MQPFLDHLERPEKTKRHKQRDCSKTGNGQTWQKNKVSLIVTLIHILAPIIIMHTSSHYLVHLALIIV